jgi:hypothetical protein
MASTKTTDTAPNAADPKLDPKLDPNSPDYVPIFDDSLGEGLTNVAARLAVYDGGDARVADKGAKGSPIHGVMLGTVELPSTITDAKTGEKRPWVGVVIELLQPTRVKEKKSGEEKVTRRWAMKGERIILTESTAFQRFSGVADHPDKVYEVLIRPVVSRTKAGQSLWDFPEVRMGRPMMRTERHLFSAEALLPESNEVESRPALPAATASA